MACASKRAVQIGATDASSRAFGLHRAPEAGPTLAMNMSIFPLPLFPAPPLVRRLRAMRPGIVAVACGLALAAYTCVAAAATDFEVETTRSGELIEVRAHATIHAPLSVVWGTLTDYEKLPEFIPGLKKSRVVSRVGATATIEQSGEARFLFLSIPIEITVESTERPPNIEVRRIAGTVRFLQGRYETEVSGDPAQVQLRWIGAITPETELPPLIGEALMRLSIQEQFAGMVREIERREAIRRQQAVAPGAGQAAQPAFRSSATPSAPRQPTQAEWRR